MTPSIRQTLGLLAVPFVLALLLIFGTPLLCAQDEGFHWQRAVQISEGHFFARKAENGYWGGKIDRDAFAFHIWFFQHYMTREPIRVSDAWHEAQSLALLPHIRMNIPFPSTASFSPVAYLPQAFGVFVARTLGANVYIQVVAGRLANLLSFFILIAAAFRILPNARYIFLALVLLPTSLHLAASLSADPLNLAIPALLLALCMRLRSDATIRLTALLRYSIFGIAIACGLLKVIAVIFVGVVLLIPGNKFSAARARWFFVLACLFASVAAAAAWNLSYPFVPGIYWDNHADPAAAVRSLIDSPMHGLLVLVHSVQNEWFQWFREYFAQMSGPGYMYRIPDALCLPVIAILTILLLADSTIRRDMRQSMALALIAILYLSALLTAFLIGFSSVGATLVEGVNGRYLFMVCLLAALAIASLKPFGDLLTKWRLPLLGLATVVQVYVVLSALHWFQGLWLYS